MRTEDARQLFSLAEAHGKLRAAIKVLESVDLTHWTGPAEVAVGAHIRLAIRRLEEAAELAARDHEALAWGRKP